MLLDDLRSEGFTLTVDAAGLHVKPRERITAEVRDRVKAARGELVAALQLEQTAECRRMWRDTSRVLAKAMPEGWEFPAELGPWSMMEDRIEAAVKAGDVDECRRLLGLYEELYRRSFAARGAA